MEKVEFREGIEERASGENSEEFEIEWKGRKEEKRPRKGWEVQTWRLREGVESSNKFEREE